MSGINAEGLSALAGILLSLGFSYIPGVSQRFGELAPTQKRLVMLGLLLACALGVFGLSCLQTGWLSMVTCDQAGAWGLARVFAAAVIANQAAFTVSPRLERTTPGVRDTAQLRGNPFAATDPAKASGQGKTQEAPGSEQDKRRVRRLSRPEGTTIRPVKSTPEGEHSASQALQEQQDDKK